jgi:DNA-binding HxlR family transcriptional regulator
VSPPKVEYELTPLGRSLLDPIKQFLEWSLQAFPEVQRARQQFDQDAPKTPVQQQ